MIKITSKSQCMACTACIQVCPQKCISMQKDDEGFLYAYANEDVCIQCGLCDKTCPLKNVWEKESPIQTCAAYSENVDNCLQSTSGGIFPLLAEEVLRKGGVVFGARFDSDWHVVMDYVEDRKDLWRFRGSKYVQADMRNTLVEAKKFLDKGRYVLFSGTPCQIAGLRHYLKKEYDNLLTIDFACHGVPSPMVWKKYLDEMKEDHFGGKEINGIQFRYKYENNWKAYRLLYRVNDETYSVPRAKDLYLRAFVDGLTIRQSCYECKCKEGRSHSDLTLADFWGVEKVLPRMDHLEGICLVNINTEKGKKFFPFGHVVCEEASLAAAVVYNEGLRAETKCHPRRTYFFENMQKTESIMTLLKKAMRPSLVKRTKDCVSSFRAILSRIIGRIRQK